MDNNTLNRFIKEYDVIYLIIVDLQTNMIYEYGDKKKLSYQGLFKRNFYNIEMIQDLYKIICNQNSPKIFKQGEVVCVIGKPFEQGVFGIFYHENREPKEFMKWAKYLYSCLIKITYIEDRSDVHTE